MNGAAFVLLTHGQTACRQHLGLPVSVLSPKIRRLKQACFLIRLKKKSQQLSSLEEICGNQSCCPSKPPRGLTEIPDVRMFSEQLVKFDSKQSRAKKKKKRTWGSLGAVLKDFMSQESRPCLLSGLPVPALGIMCFLHGLGSHTRPLVWRFLSMAA